MNLSLGLCLRLSTQIPVPHLLVLVCWALALGTSPPLAPGLLCLAPGTADVSPNAFITRSSREKKPSKIKMCFSGC